MRDTGHPATDVRTTLDPEDEKLLLLARSAAARSATGAVAGEGAAVRDEIGRTYMAAAVAVGPLRLTALQAAVAQAAASGTTRLAAVALVGDQEPDTELLAAVGNPPVLRP